MVINDASASATCWPRDNYRREPGSCGPLPAPMVPTPTPWRCWAGYR